MRPWPSRKAALAAVLLCTLLTCPVSAQNDEYDSVIRNALQEYEAGRFDEATALFQQAHALLPSARTHRGLGMAYFEARRYSLAVVHLKASLADKRRSLNARQRASATEVLRQAETFVARIQLELDPADATIEVDGHEGDFDGTVLLLDVGRHELITRAPGYQEDRRILEARAASTETLAWPSSSPRGENPDTVI